MRAMNTCFRTALVALFLIGGPAGVSRAQQAADTTAAAGSEGGLFLWNIIGKAGGFQWPIFGILVIGLFLILAKVYELFQDRWAGAALEEAPIPEMGTQEIVDLVQNQQQSMLAEMHATLLNVYRTTQDAGTLHEEVANFVQSQRERFDTFTRRVDFLADTAGAVGLLGTVWGMFTLFYGGNISDKQAILGGMGVALISTLLGLIASITLNLISTEVYSFFDSRIDQIEDEGDELRFRLLELAPRENGAASEGSVPDGSGNGQASPAVPSPAAAETSAKTSAAGGPDAGAPASTASASTASAPATAAPPTPQRLELVGIPKEGVVGAELSAVQLRAVAEDGTPVPDVPVQVQVGTDDGALNGSHAEVTLRTEEDGTVQFDWTLPEAAGRCTAEVQLPSAEASAARTLSVQARPAAPHHYRPQGNNQGAAGGQELPNPLLVALADKYKNPVPDHTVRFEVVSGGGTFGDGTRTQEVTTDEEGRAAVPFAVGAEPGLNTVEATIGSETVQFQAMTLGQ